LRANKSDRYAIIIYIQDSRPGLRIPANSKKIIEKEIIMLWTIAVILIIMWLLGFVSSYTMGGFIHILLVIAVIMVLVNVIQGRKVT
jgi:hypothetical protein